jgi:hypothetical protein
MYRQRKLIDGRFIFIRQRDDLLDIAGDALAGGFLLVGGVGDFADAAQRAVGSAMMVSSERGLPEN